MEKEVIKIIALFIAAFSVFFIALPYWVWREEGNQAVKQEELIDINGHVDTLIKTTTGGRHSEPIMYLTLQEHRTTFRIANSSYKAIIPSRVVNELKKGVKVDLKVKVSEYQRSVSKSLLDKSISFLLKWWKEPQVYSLRTGEHSLLTIEDVNKQESEHNYENIKWGIILVLFIAVRFIWVALSEEKNKEVKKRIKIL